MCKRLSLLLIASLTIVSGCSSTIAQPVRAPIEVDTSLMIAPPVSLALISDEVMAQNRIDLALPVVTENYKTYFIIKTQLIGLQDLIKQFNQEQDHGKK